jgi:hypothetical protein
VYAFIIVQFLQTTIVSINTNYTYNLSLFQANFQYDLLIWGGLNQNASRPLQLSQRKIVRICFCKNTLYGSTKENFNHYCTTI